MTFHPRKDFRMGSQSSTTAQGSYRRSSAGARGFALVVTLSLMILLTVIAVGLLSLSAISLRSSSQGLARSTAQANARLALQMAIGQLQRDMGSDRRISASAELLEGTTTPDPSKKFWTGVYRSWLAEEEDRPEADFQTWLVSGDQQDTRQRSTATTSPGVESVTLYSDGVEEVRVPTIAAPNSSGTGRIAWWTSDDNQKAALLSPPEETPLGADLRALAMSGGNGGFPLIEVDGEKPFEAVVPGDYVDGTAATFGQTALLVGANPTSSPTAFPHLTTNAGGLLTNVRQGGFRKDLSVFFEREMSEIPATALYKSDGSEGGAIGPSGPGRDGMTWSELWAFHNLPKRLTRGVSTPFTTGGTPSPSQDFIVTKTGAAILQDPWFLYSTPSYVRIQTLVSLYSELQGSAANPATQSYRMYYVLDPIVTIWNPLDIAISYKDVYQTMKFWHIPYEFIFTDAAEANPKFSRLSRSISQDTAAHFLNLRIAKQDPAILRPGEVLVYSQESGGTPVLQGNKNIETRKSWNLGGGVKYRIKLGDAGNNLYNLKPGEVFNYDINPNERTAVHVTGGKATSYGLAINDYWIYEIGGSANSYYLGNVRIDKTTDDINSQDILKATDFPEIFDKIPDGDTLTLTPEQCLVKQPVMLFNFIIKNETDSSTGAASSTSKYLSRLNPKVFANHFLHLSPSEVESFPWEVQVRPLTAGFEPIVDASSSGAGFFGPGVDAATGANRVITHSVPREHPVSLAAYQHSFANGLHHGGVGKSWADPGSRLLPGISHAIGNSLAPSILPMDRTEGILTDRDGNPIQNEWLADHSYFANTALWDDWFLSGISPQTYASFSTQRDQNGVATDFFTNAGSLPVQRYEPSLGGRDAAELVTEILDADPLEDSEFSLPAAHIRVNGMFNVNSTSVQAWKAVLASLRDLPAPAQGGSGEDVRVEKPEATPLSSLITPRNLEIDASNLGDSRDQNQWVGHRMLTDDEISPLAEAIVKQIKLRGPFLSLADFVNRRVGTDADLARTGAIQAALDDADAAVNAEQIADRSVNIPSGDRPGLLFREAENGAAAYGSAGYVKQADILTPMAPWISVRSDSFTIRAYGESQNASGETARAWCEATVERSPDYVDSTEARTTAFEDLNPINQAFGRRFQITSFRWMHPSEIR